MGDRRSVAVRERQNGHTCRYQSIGYAGKAVEKTLIVAAMGTAVSRGASAGVLSLGGRLGGRQCGRPGRSCTMVVGAVHR